jgi:hypothetical protein
MEVEFCILTKTNPKTLGSKSRRLFFSISDDDRQISLRIGGFSELYATHTDTKKINRSDNNKWAREGLGKTYTEFFILLPEPEWAIYRLSQNFCDFPPYLA